MAPWIPAAAYECAAHRSLDPRAMTNCNNYCNTINIMYLSLYVKFRTKWCHLHGAHDCMLRCPARLVQIESLPWRWSRGFRVRLINATVGLGGFGVTCSPGDQRFAGSNPAEVDGFSSGRKNPEHKFPGRDFKLGIRVWDFRLVKEP